MNKNLYIEVSIKLMSISIKTDPFLVKMRFLLNKLTFYGPFYKTISAEYPNKYLKKTKLPQKKKNDSNSN